jgi:hypothetical protein
LLAPAAADSGAPPRPIVVVDAESIAGFGAASDTGRVGVLDAALYTTVSLTMTAWRLKMAVVDYQMTVADLARMPDDGNRYEVIDGELYVTAAPHFEHQAALGQIVFAFAGWVHAGSGHRRGWPLPGAGVIFSFHAGVIPDFLWVSSERLRQVVTDPLPASDGIPRGAGSHG